MKEKLYVIKYYDIEFIVEKSDIKTFIEDWSNDEIHEGLIKELDLSNGHYQMGNYGYKNLEDFING